MTANLAADLAEVLTEHLGGPVTVSELKRLAGGSSHETWAFDATEVEHDVQKACHAFSTVVHTMVLRREFQAGMLDTDIRAEFTLLKTLFDAGIPVPEPWLYATEDSALGTPFMLMERAAGTDLRKDLARAECDRDRRALADHVVEVLARIHAVPTADLGLAERGDPSAESDPSAEIARWVAVIDAAKFDLDPLLATAITWLRGHLPPAVPAVLVHADFKANNLLIAPAGNLTVLDWELAHLGDPVEDLAWTMLWRTPWDVVGGLHTAESFLAAYANLTGRQVEPATLRFWRVFALVKLWAMFRQGLATDQPRPQLRLLGRAIVWISDQLATELLEAQ